MSVFKKLNKFNRNILSYAANKRWNLNYSCSFNEDPYINIYKGTNISETFSPNDYYVDPVTNNLYERLVYNQINNLYYQSYIDKLDTGSIMFNTETYESASQYRPTSSYFNYNNNVNQIRYFPTGSGESIIVLEVDQKIYGSKLLPNSVLISSSICTIVDDGNGNIYDSSGSLGGYNNYINNNYINSDYFKFNSSSNLTHIGNIFYPQGLIVITNQDYINLFPLPPIAYNVSASFLINTFASIPLEAISRIGLLDTGSVIITGSNVSNKIII